MAALRGNTERECKRSYDKSRTTKGCTRNHEHRYFAVLHKSKQSWDLPKLRNIRSNSLDEGHHDHIAEDDVGLELWKASSAKEREKPLF